jgi:hypothetical protein
MRQTVIDLELLVGMHEIAERAGVQRGTVLMWRQRYNHFPDPLLQLNIGPIWNWLDVEAWLHRYPARKRTV